MSQVNNKKLILVGGLALLVVALAMAGQVESCRRERRLDMARSTIASLLRLYPELANEVNNNSNQNQNQGQNQNQNQYGTNQNGQVPNNQQGQQGQQGNQGQQGQQGQQGNQGNQQANQGNQQANQGNQG